MRSIGSILLAVGFIGLFAQLAYDIPVGNGVVPISGQTFALFLAAWFLRPAQTVIAVLLYILLGGLGLPLFADGASGWQHLSGFTAGYLWMFLPAAVLVSYYSQRTTKQSFFKVFIVMLFASFLVLFVGAFYLAWKTGEPTYFREGSLPFLPGGIIKSLIGAGIAYAVGKYSISKQEP